MTNPTNKTTLASTLNTILFPYTGAGAVVVLSGVSGSGKSSFVSSFTSKAEENNIRWQKFSADDFFYNADGEYKFDPRYLGQAHQRCLREFAEAAQQGYNPYKKEERDFLLVDNTNTTALEIAPYAALSGAYNRPLILVTFVCDPFVAAERNKGRAPLSVVFEQDQRLRAREIPGFWNMTKIFINTNG
jgi:predicted kinase